MRPFMFVLSFLMAASPALAQMSSDPVPLRRLLVERNVDYYGSDIQPQFDVTLETCTTVCLSDPSCTAFTFNSRSNSCFPKRGVERREAYEGAISATVVERPAASLAVAEARAEQVSFLGTRIMEAARELADAVPLEAGDAAADLAAVRQAADASGTSPVALRWRAAAAAVSDLSSDWWAFAEAARTVNAEDRAEGRRLRARAVPAAVNAYLRAGTVEDQRRALLTLAAALEQDREGRLALGVLRLAGAETPSAEVAAALDRAAAQYGLRVTESRAESGSAEPRICAVFSEPLDAGVDYRPYVQMPGVSFALDVDGRQLCIAGVTHGTRYRAVFRAGLPAASGEGLIKDTPIALYVRDRAPIARFPGRAYVLPRSAGAQVPVVSVNAEELDLRLSRISDRNLRQLLSEGLFGRPLNAWETDRLGSNLAEEVWRGQAEVTPELNVEVTTSLPLGDAVADISPGLYALSARVPGSDPYERPEATQWFLISDLGVATAQGRDGLHVFVRSLETAAPVFGASIDLVSRANRVLARAATNEDGYALIPPGELAGRAGAAPALVTVRTGDSDAPQDFVFLSLTEPEFDLSDRGVEGRPASGPIDVFLATDRGAYRAGETVHATVLARDPSVQAVSGLPMTAVLTRPDGVDYTREVSADGSAGGHVFSLALGPTVPRGTWQLAIYADPEAPALARRSLLVEDFVPERIDVTLTPQPDAVPPGGRTSVGVQADWYFGAPGSGLAVEGDVVLRAAETLPDWPGFAFGAYDIAFEPLFGSLPPAQTGGDGAARVPFDLPEAGQPGRPLTAEVTVRVADSAGRPVERRADLAVAQGGPVLGIKPLFDSAVAEGDAARFELVAVGPDGNAVPLRAQWTVNRVETRYQWYARRGSWNWEPVTRRTRIDGGEVTLGQGPTPLNVPVDWGRYEIVVEGLTGPYAESALAFNAGWFAPAEARSAPDRLELSLDREGYRPGDTALLRIVPRMAGIASIQVVSDRLIDVQAVEVGEDPVEIALPVTEEWGPGAYVTATLIRPMDVAAERNPARAIGLAHASVDPGAARLTARIEAPETARPRGPLDVALQVEGLAEGETAWVTLAAVDQGILNLTGHEPPDPVAHYFGQRRLGMALRDVYGRLIDGFNGAPGRLRSGGDGGARMRAEAPPPTEDLMAQFSGPLQVGPDGRVETTFDVPSFNGSVRLMAVIWSDRGLGQAETTVVVRDPIVMTMGVPRFLAPGDQAALRLDLTHADGPPGSVALAVSADGVSLAPGAFPESVDISEGETVRLAAPITAGLASTAQIAVTVTGPDGVPRVHDVSLPIRSNDPEIAITARFALADGADFTLTDDVFADFRPGTGQATLALGPLAQFDVPGLLAALDRVPWGCTEQVTSQALPLLYFQPVAEALGLNAVASVEDRLAQAIDRVLARQNASGGFGLWGTFDGDLWLNAYVTDFLSRARAQGLDVPEPAFSAALDALANGVSAAPDFDAETPGGGRALAYALYVLAREGRALIGDLRYYADAKAGDFVAPLAVAQLGAALALYGEADRAERMFARAMALLETSGTAAEAQTWRTDYGSRMRDAAAMLTLASETGIASVDRGELARRIASPMRQRSTQEAVWTLLAAQSLAAPGPSSGFLIDGDPADGPLVTRWADTQPQPPSVIGNRSGQDTELTITRSGVPLVAPEPGGTGYRIERAFYSRDGAPVDPQVVAQGTRLVAVLTVIPFGERAGRLMVTDPLPAGFEIETPSLLQGGDLSGLSWLESVEPANAEFREDRFLAAVDWRTDEAFRLAYSVRAVSPGRFHYPAPSVEDMYRPQFRARGATGSVTVTP